MKAAIHQLEVTLATLTNNEPINRAEGNAVQADLEARCAAEIRQALAVLNAAEAASREVRTEGSGKTPEERAELEDGLRHRISSEND
jgi:hypothetical protein